MTLFALVEVVMIIVGIVLANHFEKQKELADIREDALVLFLAVLDDLELDILNSERIILRNVRHNITSDVLMDPHSSAEDLELNLPYLDNLLSYYSNYNIHKRGFQGLRKIHEDLPEEWVEIYEELDLFMDQAINIDIYNERFQKTIYATIDHHVENYPWYIHDTYNQQMSREFIEWTSSNTCKAQTMAILNDMGNLSYVAMMYRLKAVRLHEAIIKALGIENHEAKHLHKVQPAPGTLSQCSGTYKLLNQGLQSTNTMDDWLVFEENNQLLAMHPGGDTLMLEYCASDTYHATNGGEDLMYFTNNELRLVRFGITRDLVFTKQ